MKLIKKFPKKFLIAITIIILVLGYFIFSRTNDSKRLQFTQVERQSLRQEVTGSGTLTGKNTANLHFTTNGKLGFVNVEVGDTIAKWSTVAGLDRENFEINLRQAENTLRDRRAIVDKIKDDLKDVTSESYEQRQTRTTAEVAQDNAYEAVLAARKALKDSYLVSPISGIVTEVSFVEGQPILVSDIIVQVVDTSELYFEAEIDEADIGRVSTGLPAEIAVDAYTDKIFKGSVSKIVPKTSNTASGAKIVVVKIKLEDAVLNFINGLTGQANIIIKEKKNILTIPQEALREDNSVVLKENQRLIPKKVKIGISSDTDIEIKKGLKEGDKILLNPSSLPLDQSRSPIGRIFRFFGGGSPSFRYGEAGRSR